MPGQQSVLFSDPEPKRAGALQREYICVLNPTGQVVRRNRESPAHEWETTITGKLGRGDWKDVCRELGWLVEDKDPIKPGDVVAASRFYPRAKPQAHTGGVTIDSGGTQKHPHFLEIGDRVKGRKLRHSPVYEAHAVKSELLGTRQPRGGVYAYWRPIPGQYEDEPPIEVTIAHWDQTRVERYPNPRRKDCHEYRRANPGAVYIQWDMEGEASMAPDMERRIASMPLGNWKGHSVIAEGLVVHSLPDDIRYKFSAAELRVGAAVPEYERSRTNGTLATLKRIEVRNTDAYGRDEPIILVWLDDPRLDVDGPYSLKSCATSEHGTYALQSMYENRVGWDLYREWQREQAEFLKWKAAQ